MSLLHSAGGSAPRILISCPCMQLLRRPFRGSRRLLWGADRLGVCCEAGSGRPDCRLCTGPTLGREILRGPGPGGGPFLLSPPKIVFVWLLVSPLCRAVRSIGSPASSIYCQRPFPTSQRSFPALRSSPPTIPLQQHHPKTIFTPISRLTCLHRSGSLAASRLIPLTPARPLGILGRPPSPPSAATSPL